MTRKRKWRKRILPKQQEDARLAAELEKKNAKLAIKLEEAAKEKAKLESLAVLQAKIDKELQVELAKGLKELAIDAKPAKTATKVKNVSKTVRKKKQTV